MVSYCPTAFSTFCPHRHLKKNDLSFSSFHLLLCSTLLPFCIWIPLSPPFLSSVFYLLCFVLFFLFFLRGASEGKLVVLSLAIGVAEQDDFANIPDLQETAQAAPPANQEPPPEKRYHITCERACVCAFK